MCRGKDYWTNILYHINNSFVQPLDSVDREWISMTHGGRGKTLGGVMSSLKLRGLVIREKPYRPYILLGVLDRIARELDRDASPHG